jgi:NDP-sugar pyrophosphorylase family protein
MLNLLPMAGGGSRFKEAGYRVPKPMIPVLGTPMVVTACRSFPEADRWIFLCNQEHLRKYPLKDVLSAEFPGVEVIDVATLTEGQAATCLLAKDRLDPSEPLFIASCDYQTVYDAQKYAALTADPSIDAIIWVFRGKKIVQKNPRAFAYCVSDGGRVTKVVEKELISDNPGEDPAVVGSFFFRSASRFVEGAEAMIRKNIRVNNEFYVGTSINQLIEKGGRVAMFEVDQFVSFGDPLELAVFNFWEEYFHRERHGSKRPGAAA